jgi:hypothetical protein
VNSGRRMADGDGVAETKVSRCLSHSSSLRSPFFHRPPSAVRRSQS